MAFPFARKVDEAGTPQPLKIVRNLTASAQVINIGNRSEADRNKKFRQSWQEEAWAYRDSVPELGYAMRFIANSTGRMRLYVAAYKNADDEQPVPIAESGLPAALVAAAQDALTRLGGSRLAVTALLKPLSENFEVAGECYLLGREDPDNPGMEKWEIKSIDEIRVTDRGYKVMDFPSAGGSDEGEDIPADAFLVRLWNPHPRWSKLADCAMRQLLDVAEELMILSRDIRASGRSRLAGNGILKVPTGLIIGGPDDAEATDNADEDPFMRDLTQAMIAPIEDEGMASAVVPIVVHGSPEQLKELQHMPLSRPIDATSANTRKELRERMAIGIDLPNQVIEGTGDLNHWSAWQVDDNTFRHHLEPKIITYVDALTLGFLHAVLKANTIKFLPEDINRVVIWYDPTELVTHPDRTADAKELWDKGVLSDDALLLAAGWTDKDKPDKEEFLLRMVQHTKTWDPGISGAILHRFDPTLPITIPSGETPVKNDPKAPGAPPPNQPDPNQPTQGPPSEPAPGAPPKAPPGAPPVPPASAARVPGTVNLAASRTLVDIDHVLREKLHVAATEVVKKQLERAGARVRSKMQSNKQAKLVAGGTPNIGLVAKLGKELVAALGFNEQELLNADYSELSQQWTTWTRAAQKKALKTATKLANADATKASVINRLAAADEAMAGDANAGWGYLEQSLRRISMSKLYDPHPNAVAVGADTEGELVPKGIIRAAVSIAGGFNGKTTSGGLDADGVPVVEGEVLTQIGSGDTITSLLADLGGVEQQGYEWVHGDSDNPFPPHEDLDGVVFQSFTDDSLSGSVFGGMEYWAPGDHSGCSCDFMPLWATTDEGAASIDELA